MRTPTEGPRRLVLFYALALTVDIDVLERVLELKLADPLQAPDGTLICGRGCARHEHPCQQQARIPFVPCNRHEPLDLIVMELEPNLVQQTTFLKRPPIAQGTCLNE